MRYVESGELVLPVVGFGTYHLTDRMGEPEAVDRILEAQAAGITVVDTSDNYRTELVVGKALFESEDPCDLFIATKTGLATSYEEARRMRTEGRKADTSPERIKRQLQRSLRMLGTSMVDLYQLHAHDVLTPAEDVAATMHEIVVDERRAYRYGVSNYDADELSALLEACDQFGFVRPATYQPSYNMLTDFGNDDAIRLARDEGMVVLAHSPLHKGFLADRMVDAFAGAIEDGKGQDRLPKERLDNLQGAAEQVQRLREYANAHGYSLSEFAIAWLVNQPQTVVLNACTTVEYIQSAVRASDWEIDAEGLALVQEVRSNESVRAAAGEILEMSQASKYYYKKL